MERVVQPLVVPAGAAQPGAGCGHWRRICREELLWERGQPRAGEGPSSALQRPLLQERKRTDLQTPTAKCKWGCLLLTAEAKLRSELLWEPVCKMQLATLGRGYSL